ncbi:MAG TPA: LURP-one-related family protein [Caproiciproducens sp.]|nr:LURP-one-related family protein [Caproiciproducens sp.]
MQFFLQQSADPDTLFAVLDSSGQPVYRVTGDSLAVGSKIYLVDQNQNEAARIFSVGLPTIAKYSIFIDDKERARVTRNLTVSRQPIKIKKVSWHFRGDLASRSYDIVDIDSTVVMSHGRCWNSVGDCYALDIQRESDILICLCLSVILDSTVIGGTPAAVPAN